MWRAVTIPGMVIEDEVESLWGTATELYAGTNYGTTYHRGASCAWTANKVANTIDGIWGSGPGDGVTGAILHLRAGTWTVEPIEDLMHRVWGSSATDVWAAGVGYGTLYSSKGDGTWRATVAGSLRACSCKSSISLCLCRRDPLLELSKRDVGPGGGSDRVIRSGVRKTKTSDTAATYSPSPRGCVIPVHVRLFPLRPV